MLRRDVFEQPKSGKRRAVLGLPSGQRLRCWLDIEHTVFAWHVHGYHGPIGMHRVHRRPVSGRERIDGVQDVRWWQVLSTRGVGRVALPYWHVLEQHRSGSRIRMH